MLTGAEFDLGSPLPVEKAETVEGAKILEKSNSSCRIAKETFKFHCIPSSLETCPYVCTWFLLPPVASTGARLFPVNKENVN